MSILIAMLVALAPQSAVPERLENQDPETRLGEVQACGRLKITTAVSRLIERLQDSDERVQKAALAALIKITNEKSLTDHAAWRAWWENGGNFRFPETPLAPSALLKEIDERIQKAELRADAAKREVRAIATVGVVAILLFMIVMLFFVGHVSSKIKGWRELVSRAEVYVKHGQELTERTDKISAELESKRAEMAAALEKLRKEQEEEIARRGDELGNGLALQLRMELQTLRQRAEKELQQTVTDLKTQIESTARRAAANK